LKIVFEFSKVVAFIVCFCYVFLCKIAMQLHVIRLIKRKPMQTLTKISQRFDHIFQLSVQA